MGEVFRVLGSQLDANDFYLDVKVVQINVDGEVILKDVTEGHSDPPDIPDGQDDYQFAESTNGYWVHTLETIHDWEDRTLAARRDNLNAPNHAAWNRIGELYELRSDPAMGAIASTIETTLADIFGTLLAEMDEG